MIISKCPLRVSLVGGSTDLQSFIDKYGYGKVISFPISLYTYITISKRFDRLYKIDYSSQECYINPNKIKNDIARELILYFDLPPITISFNADIPTSGSGLAASSSYMVAAVAAACKFKGLEWSQAKICKIAHEIELKFNPLTGYQDTYGCGLPSAKLMLFNKKGDVDIKFVDLPKFKMYLYNTNGVRSSTNILKTIDIKKSYPLLKLVDKVYENLNNSDQFFDLLRDAWETKKKTSKDILSHDFLVKFDKQMNLEPEVKFHKLCGAGGGGYFLIMSEDSFSNPGLKITPNIDNKGVIVWEI
jgi:D-glycero-alpha-D-manno-heptose-7-phosphate kinase